ncbi:MAG: TrbI/VirB10 family protein [Geminicoccaceae bacterium]
MPTSTVARIIWDRLLMPNGNSIGLESVAGTGKANATGLEDQVDEHILGLVVAVLLSSIISADDSFIDGLGDSDA